MDGFKLFGRKKRRKYPVKVDEEGRSARSRCFEMFAEKAPLDEIAKQLDVKIDTVSRYHQQWKKDPRFERRYDYVKSLFNKTSPERDKNMEMFANAWGFSKEQLELILSQPHGLRRLMTRKIQSPAHAEADRKRHLALALALLISDFLIKEGGKYEDAYYALRRYMHESIENRKSEDADINEYNEKMKLVHNILAAAMKQEQEGRVKPDILSEEERNVVMRLEFQSQTKELQVLYWIRKAELMFNGFTQEQAREKMYQDLIDNGNLQGAKKMREFQDKYDPLKTNDQTTPPSPTQPLSPI
jgi:phage terminase small subunit